MVAVHSVAVLVQIAIHGESLLSHLLQQIAVCKKRKPIDDFRFLFYSLKSGSGNRPVIQLRFDIIAQGDCP